MSKVDQIRAMREARASRSNPAAKATKGKAARLGSQEAPVRPAVSEPADRVASRLRAGRTAQDAAPSSDAGRVAIQGGVSVDKVQEAREQAPHLEMGSTPVPSTKRSRGRPKVEGKRPWEAEGISRRTWYRRKAEERQS